MLIHIRLFLFLFFKKNILCSHLIGSGFRLNDKRIGMRSSRRGSWQTLAQYTSWQRNRLRLRNRRTFFHSKTTHVSSVSLRGFLLALDPCAIVIANQTPTNEEIARNVLYTSADCLPRSFTLFDFRRAPRLFASWSIVHRLRQKTGQWGDNCR